MIYLDKTKHNIITYMVGDKVQLQATKVDEKEAIAYAKALAKKHKVKLKDNAKADTKPE